MNTEQLSHKAKVFNAVKGFESSRKRCKCGKIRKHPCRCCSGGCSSILARANVAGGGFAGGISPNADRSRVVILR